MKVLMNMRIGLRLGLGFSLAVTLTLLVGLMALNYIHNLSELTNKLYRHPFTVSTSILRVREGVTSMHRYMKDVALSRDEAGIDAAAARVSAIEERTLEHFALLKERFLGDKRRIDELRQIFVDWKPIRDEVISLMRRNERAAAADITKAKGADYIANLYDKLEGIEQFASNKADEFVTNANSQAEAAIRITVAALITAMLIAAVFAYLITRSITGPIRELLGISGAIAEGDLTQVVMVKSHDEIGQLQHSMAAMVTELRDIVSQVHHSTDKVTDSAAEIAQGNADLLQRTGMQSASLVENLEQTNANLAEFTTTVKRNAEEAHNASELGEQVRSEVEKGSTVINQAVVAMGDISEASTQIVNIIGVIDEIAFQTNLLALNAAVEAARAGEQGRGFAVVASEVRNLAQRSATAAREIKDLIQVNVSKVQDGSRLVNAAGEALQEIVRASRQVSDIVAKIATASSQQAAGVDQVNQSITHMGMITQQNAEQVEKAASASETMATEATKLTQLMGFFTLSDSHNDSIAALPMEHQR